jgi:hypothetical protein
VRIVFAAVCFVIVYEPTFSPGWTVCFLAFVGLFVLCKVGSTKKLFQVQSPPQPQAG